MTEIRIDPFEHVRKNAHVWRGEKSIISYTEKLDSSFSVLVLYELENKKRRLFLAVDEKNAKVEFKNEEIDADLFTHLCSEIEVIKKFLSTNQEHQGNKSSIS